MSDFALPGLVGLCVWTETGGAWRNVGRCVGWDDGYVVAVDPLGRLDKVAATSVRCLPDGWVPFRAAPGEPVTVRPPGRPAPTSLPSG